MSTGFKVMYRLGIVPWDRGVIPRELTALIEGPSALPAGRALDIGCGTGTQVVYLAQRGWQVTGVDVVERAVKAAREKAATAGVPVDVRVGDVTDLPGLGLEPGYALLLDMGCFHGLPDHARAACVQGLTELAAADATLLLMGFQPGRRGPAPGGVDRAEVDARFEGWRVVDDHPDSGPPPPGPLRNAKPTWYRLVRR
jgi:SAM-dependent methyltransferase